MCDDDAVSEADELQEDINQKLRAYSYNIANNDQFLKKLFFETLPLPDEDFKEVYSFFGLEQVHFVKRALMALISPILLCAGWVIEFAIRVMKALIDCYTILRKFLFPSKREYALLCPSRFARSISSYLQARFGEQVFQTKICFLGQHSEVKV